MTALRKQKGGIPNWRKAWGGVPRRATVLLLIAYFALLGVLFLIPSCSSGQSAPSTSEAPASVNATPQREFPSFVYNSAQVLQAYQTAVRIPEVLPLMPCYCNCGQAHDHKSLKDCFFKEDGSLNDHGAFCEVCYMEVADVVKWQGEGYSLEQIRGLIEEKYPPYGEPTDTAPFVHLELSSEATSELSVGKSGGELRISSEETPVVTWQVPLTASARYSLHFKNAGDNPLTVVDTWAQAMGAC